MAGDGSFEGTAAWLRGQWSNPGDIFTILLLIGGDIVQTAIAQLCAGPVPGLTPVSFSFGWVTYAVSAMLSAVGNNRLMPSPEVDCIIINAKSGFARTNYSWILSRMLRDFDHWRPALCDRLEQEKLNELREINRSSAKPRDEDEIRVALRVSVWECNSATGRGSGDVIYWIGLFVTAVQFGIAAIPWGLYGEWYTFFVIGAGTALAYAGGALPQWWDEKVGIRKLKYTDTTKERKDVFLTEGNGSHDAILILGCEGGLDLEALAASQRELRSPWTTRVLSFTLAICWIALLISVSGWEQHTWYVLAAGMLGLVHNVIVAGVPRQPQAFGIDLVHRETIVEGKVMQVLRLVEESHPRAGAALLEIFFPGKLFPREQLMWEYAERRAEAWKENSKKVGHVARTEAWPMPPLQSPLPKKDGKKDDSDIPESGPYTYDGGPSNWDSRPQAVLGASRPSKDHVVTVE
ncbi:uncharacterized protein LTR77_001612 [Saxophila tyrrhenica]|uniref:Uncharacterized protein n=1 Tax=Saxophila tyrrhenica TaxID=1690608 RepID=A0AAV9PQE5_9PEZI|nr:hypothetical protein LTR77_001612 [Saxophila tyrrhenica]